MSASCYEEQNNTYGVPSWMSTDISTDPGDVHMRRNILRTFLDTAADIILLRTRSHTEQAHRNNSHPSYAQTLYDLLISKGVDIPNPHESEYGINFFLGLHLFPSDFEIPPPRRIS